LPFVGSVRCSVARVVGRTFGLLFRMDYDRADPSDHRNV
jgi:hypothetical protein